MKLMHPAKIYAGNPNTLKPTFMLYLLFDPFLNAYIFLTRDLGALTVITLNLLLYKEESVMRNGYHESRLNKLHLAMLHTLIRRSRSRGNSYTIVLSLLGRFHST